MSEWINLSKISDKCSAGTCDGSGQIYWKDPGKKEHRMWYDHLTICDCHYDKYICDQWERTVGMHDSWVKLATLQPNAKGNRETS